MRGKTVSDGRAGAITVSGKNTVGVYIIPLALIQHTAHKQNTVCLFNQ